MPVITCVLIEGYAETTRRLLAQRLTDAARHTTGAPWDGITVMINELPDSDYMHGRVGRIPAKAPLPPADLARGFLDAMEARDLATAKTFLAESFSMAFPNSPVFHSLEELVDWSAGRYQSVRKNYEGTDECLGPTGVTVYCHGTLSGAWPDGTPFEGIRFIDRFTVVDGKLTDHRVWNDMAEVRPR